MTAAQHSQAGIRVLVVGDHIGHAGGAIHGATTYYLDVLPRLQQEGVEVGACFLGHPHPAGERLAAAGIETLFLGRSKWDPRALPDLVGVIRRRRVNLLHAGGMKGILVTRVASRITDVPVISHFHDSNPVGSGLRSLHRLSARWDAAALAISEAVSDFAVAELGARPDRTRVLHNGIDPERMAAASAADGEMLRAALEIPSGVPVVGVIGRFSLEKGHEPFIRSLPGLLVARPELRVLLVGDGARRLTCERLVDELGVKHAVRFTGFRNDIPVVMQAVDIVAIPSLEEGLSYTAMEAMAAGRPVAAMAVGGLPEIIRHGETGLLTAPGDTAGLCQAVLRVLADAALRERLVAGGREMAAQLSIASHVGALLREYNQALAARGTS